MKNRIIKIFIFLLCVYASINCYGQQTSIFSWDAYDCLFESNSINKYIQTKPSDEKKRNKRDRDDYNEMYEYRLRQQREAEKRLQEELQREREAEIKRKRQAAQKAREEEFEAGHKQLQASLRSLPDYANGLKGQSKTKYGLRGLDDNGMTSVPSNSATEPHLDNKPIEKAPAPRSKTKKSKPYYHNVDNYLQVVVDTDPQPAYYQGRPFWTIGAEIDIDDEEGGWEWSGFDGNKIVKDFEVGMWMSWTKKKIGKTTIGATFVQVYDNISTAVDIRNTETSIITRTLSAVKKAIITEDKRYIEETNIANAKDVAELNMKEAVGWLQNFLTKKMVE